MYRFSVLLAVCASAVFCADPPAAKLPDPSPDQIKQIIQKFAKKEAEFAAAREQYTYRQSTKMEETDPQGGSYEMVEEVSFDDRNRRTSHVTKAPATTLQNILMTSEDEQDFRNTMPFVFTSADDIEDYNIKYLGHEQVDEITCYVFSLSPKEHPQNDKRRFFEGQIWVDDQDYQIVKTYGKGINAKKRRDKQQFPKFTTYRQQIDDKYWFPTYTYADDTLNFEDGQAQRIKVVVKYDHYKKYQFKTETSITYDTPANTQPQPAKPPK